MDQPRPSTNPRAAFEHAVEHAAHLLPTQGPIGEFIHHNTLHAYEHLPFHDALTQAAETHDAEVYWPEAKFRESLALGHFGAADVEVVLDERFRQVADQTIGPLTRRRIERTMLLHDVVFAEPDDVPKPLLEACLAIAAGAPLAPRAALPLRTHRECALAHGASDPAVPVDGELVRFLSAYLDQGMARWPMPDRDRGLLPCLVTYLAAGRSYAPAFVRRALTRLAGAGAEDGTRLATAALAELGVAPDEYEDYLAAFVLELSGFAGMIAVLEGDGLLRPGDLRGFVAARLVLIVESLRDTLREARLPLSFHALVEAVRTRRVAVAPERDRHPIELAHLALRTGLDASALLSLGTTFATRALAVMDAFDSRTRRRLLQEAMEHGHLESIATALGRDVEPPCAERPPARFQSIFCIDDREEGIRRHFETLDTRHETFGVAGFFGVAMRYQSFDDPNQRALCPVVVSPRHAVVERPRQGHDLRGRRRLRLRRIVAATELEISDASRSFVRGLFVMPLLGVLAVVPLVFRVFFPHLADRLARKLESLLIPPVGTDLAIARDGNPDHDDAPDPNALVQGFTLEERVERVAGMLEDVGLVRAFAPIVAVLGHGASTVNNPHHSAYDCGACGGASGGPNARAFAAMANDRDVRAALVTRGIAVPETTWFIGGLHDTTTDGVTLFDVETVPSDLRSELDALRLALDDARGRSAQERCRRFEHARTELGPRQALRHVEERSVDLSQARPELGHATNAACIVGRRALSRGLFLDRRSFLVSYDPSLDDDAQILERILGAVGPVCAGINLEYYFSSVDPDRWGSGTKLPHNLVGLVGVMEGTSGDLRTGLPREMIEVHEPVRLLMVVDASVEDLEKVLARSAVVRTLVGHRWIRVLSIDPRTGAMLVYGDRGFEPLTLTEGAELRSFHSARDWYRGRRESLRPVRIVSSSDLAGA